MKEVTGSAHQILSPQQQQQSFFLVHSNRQNKHVCIEKEWTSKIACNNRRGYVPAIHSVVLLSFIPPLINIFFLDAIVYTKCTFQNLTQQSAQFQFLFHISWSTVTARISTHHEMMYYLLSFTSQSIQHLDAKALHKMHSKFSNCCGLLLFRRICIDDRSRQKQREQGEQIHQ